MTSPASAPVDTHAPEMSAAMMNRVDMGINQESTPEGTPEATEAATLRPTVRPTVRPTLVPTVQPTTFVVTTADVNAQATHDKQWYATTLGLVFIVIVIALGNLANLIRGLLRRSRAR